MIRLEVCIDSIQEAVVASDLGIDRLEVCAALDLGGLTPGPGFIQQCAKITGIESHIMIRPRAGNFTYSEKELEVMRRDIEFAAEKACAGVVFGLLDTDNQVDLEHSSQLLEIARGNGLEATFHRAFDQVSHPEQALEQLIELGFDRVLTSGLQPLAIQGLSTIRELVEQAAGRIQIMAGSGVNPTNAPLLLTTGVQALHFSARKNVADASGMNMGDSYLPKPDKIVAIKEAIAFS